MNQEEQSKAQASIELDLSQQRNASETTATVKPLNNAKKWLAFALPVVAVVLIVAVLICTVAGGSPLKKAEKSIAKTASALSKAEPARVMNQVLTSGSMEFVMDLNKITESSLGTGIDGTYSVKMYTDTKKQRVAGMINLALGDAQLDAALYSSGGVLVLDSAALLDGALGFDLKNASERLAASIFNPDRGTKYAINSEIYDSLQNLLEKQDTADPFNQDTEKLLQEAYSALRKSVETNASVTEKAGTISCFGEDVNVNTITIELNKQATIAVTKELLTWASESERLRTWFDQLIALYAESLGVRYSSRSFTFDENTAEKFYRALEDALNSIDELETVLSDDLVLAYQFHIRKSGGTLAQIGFHAGLNGEADSADFTISFAANPLEGIMVAYADDITDVTGTYIVDCDTETAYHAEFVAIDDGDPLYTIDFTWDKAGGDFCVSFVDELMEDEVKLYGTMTCAKQTVTIYLDRADAGVNVNLGMTLTLKESDTMPAMPKYTDILSYTDETAFDEVASGVLTRFNELIADLGLYY